MYTFSSLDTYKISHSKKNEKLNVDYKVLVRLYQPIIGSIALSLYLTLESEISLNKSNKTNFNIARLHKLLQIDENQFNVAVETLKEYGLISYKANQRKANDYLFVMYPTKTATEFLEDEKLNKALQVIVDENYYQQIYSYFISSIISEDEYVDIEDVKLSKELTEDEFYEQFYEKYPVIASYNQSISLQAKTEIQRLKKLFNLNYTEIENAILNSFDYENEQMKVNLVKLNQFIENKYQTKQKEKEKSSDEKIAEAFESERSIAYYKKLSGRTTLLPRETAMINELLDEYKISEGVLNVVINYYFKYGQHTLGVPKNYFIKIIEEMLLNNVKTTIDAMNYFRNRNKRIQRYNEQKKQSEQKRFVQEEKKVIEKNEEEINPETLAEFRKLLGGK